MLAMTDVIPNGTKVLLYRPLGADNVTVGEVHLYDPERGTYEITDNGGTTEIMRPGLDFVLPRRGVQVINYRRNAAAKILSWRAGMWQSGSVWLTVQYEGQDLQDVSHSFIDWENAENFRYAGLPIMNEGQQVKVYPGRYWDRVNNRAANNSAFYVRGKTGTILRNLIRSEGVYEVEVGNIVCKVQRDEAMPVREDEEVPAEDEAAAGVEIEQREPAFTVTEPKPEAGVYVCNDEGEFRRLKTEDLTTLSIKECAVCLQEKEEKDLYACVPCGHRCICKECSTTLQARGNPKCPLCRAPITKTLRVFNRFLIEI